MKSEFRRVAHVITRLALALVLLFAWAGSSAWAQTAPDEASDVPAPARLSVAEGAVSFWRPGDQDWSPAQLNMALEAGDAIYAGNGATVEIQIGPRAFLRLMADTQIRFVRRDAGLVQVSLASGDASFDLRSQTPGQLVEIDTPNAAFAIDGNGYYRVGFRDDATRFFVRRDGRATLELRDGYDRTISPGEQIIVRGTTELTAEVAAAPAPDSWDRWNDARTDYYDQAASNRYLPPQVYGAADLDQYGTWSDAPDYGTVWYPTVAPGWAPYSVGTWAWDPVYEWTWVDREPWGWAPSHYGRWVSIAGRWAWAPGPRVSHPMYAPAVVGFLGFGGGPEVGWVALSWGEPITPWWGHQGFRGRPSWGGWGGPRIVNNTVIRQNTTINVNNIRYRNSQVSHAVVAVRQDEFGRDHERRDQDRHFRFVTPQAGRPTPIQGVLPMRRQAAPVTATAPVAPNARAVPGGVGRRDFEPAQRGPVSTVPSVVAPLPSQPQRESRPESRHPMPAPTQSPAPQGYPHTTTINRAPVPESQPQVVEQRAPQERRDDRPRPASRQVEVAPAPARQEIAPQPRHTITIQPAPAPAREAHSTEVQHKTEAPPPREGQQHREANDRRKGPRSEDADQRQNSR